MFISLFEKKKENSSRDLTDFIIWNRLQAEQVAIDSGGKWIENRWSLREGRGKRAEILWIRCVCFLECHETENRYKENRILSPQQCVAICEIFVQLVAIEEFKLH